MCRIDVVLTRLDIVFCEGCRWHGCSGCTIGAVLSGCAPVDTHPTSNEHRCALLIALIGGHSEGSNRAYDDGEADDNRQALPPSQRVHNADNHGAGFYLIARCLQTCKGGSVILVTK